MYCIGCGEPLRAETGSCPKCATPVCGADFSEKVLLDYGKPFVVPWVCCCCLAPRFETTKQEIATITLTGNKRYTYVSIPWCAGCKNRNKTFDRLGAVAWMVASGLLYLLLGAFALDSGARFALSLLGGFAGLLASPHIFRRQSEQAALPGHVPRCDAASGGAGRQRAELTFKNKAFARIWRELNAGIDCKAPCLAWDHQAGRLGQATEGTSPPETPSPAPKGWAAHEARANLREQILAGKPNLTSRVHFTRGAAGADSSAGILRFVVTEIEIHEGGLRISTKKRKGIEVPWVSIARVCARQTPQAPPFDGTIFLDIVSTVANGGPFRLLPNTRANYAALPGAGVTSHENFRRLVRQMKTKNPNLLVEPASIPYLDASSVFPPRFDQLDELIDYDTQYT